MPTSPHKATAFSLPAATPPQAAASRRLPGRWRPRAEVLREYLDLNDRRRERIEPVLWDFWAPGPEKVYRWRIQVDCGCITEVLTYGDSKLPHERTWHDHVNQGFIPVGHFLCFHDDDPPPPYRDIADWGTRREVSFPADPADPRRHLLIRRSLTANDKGIRELAFYLC
ncbi:MAG: hypothetical protein ABIP92_13230, partial [Arthrobacter sp.]